MTTSTNRPLVIISSGAYTEPELTAELGRLPPTFLPVGLGRLFEKQVSMFSHMHPEIIITVPDTFSMPSWDAERLNDLGVRVVSTPDHLSLGQALLHTLNCVDGLARPLRLLLGDTMVQGVDLYAEDVMAVASGGDGYRWAYAKLRDDGCVANITGVEEIRNFSSDPRVCGYFAFKSASLLADKLLLAEGNFLGSLNLFAAAVDLRVVAPECWLDFGHVQTYFRSRQIVTTQRAFNSLEITATHVRKRSTSAPEKLRAEAQWLREAPSHLSPYCARLLGDGDDEAGYFYETEYEYLPTLSELYVLGNLSTYAWRRILNCCGDFIDASVVAGCSRTSPGSLTKLTLDKTYERLEAFSREAKLDIEASNRLNGKAAPSIRAILESIAPIISNCGERPSFMHGDFCFSNILYNFRTERIRVIDPRALDHQGRYSALGDCRYDLAKLMHSVSGRYDLIMADRFTGGRTGSQAFDLSFRISPWQEELDMFVRDQVMGGVRLGSAEVYTAMISLFLSMPPLHFDRPDRQVAFIANALRLYLEMDA